MSHEKTLLHIIRICGIISFLLLLISQTPPLLLWVCSGHKDYGDLYKEAKVRDFKAKLPGLIGEKPEDGRPSQAADYRVFLQGDSFSIARRGSRPFLVLLSARLKEPIYLGNLKNPNPACIFQHLSRDLAKSKRRVVIVESVERKIVSRFGSVRNCPPQPKPENAPLALAKEIVGALLFNTEKNLRFLFHNSALTAPIVESWNSLVFRVSGEISAQTPVYSLNPPFLFYFEETDRHSKSSFYFNHTDELIRKLADNIKMMRDALQSQFNAELVFLPIPNKYTLYHRLVNNDPYDDFLPRLYRELERRGVPTVRLYDPFLRAPGFIYFPTDTHWNERGIGIAVDETIKVINSL